MPARGLPEPAAGATDYGGVIPVEGMAALAPSFDGLILDQWGVLHDGTRAYAGAIECLEQLRAAGVTIDEKREEWEYGRFAWIMDPEGNKVELWQPMVWDEKNKQP